MFGVPSLLRWLHSDRPRTFSMPTGPSPWWPEAARCPGSGTRTSCGQLPGLQCEDADAADRLPYNLGPDDSVVAVEHQPMPQYERPIRRTVDQVRTNAQHGARVPPLPTHPYPLGVGRRFAAYLAIIDELMAADDVVFATSGEIADRYLAQCLPPSPSPA